MAETMTTNGETPAEWMERLGMDGHKWAAEFRKTALSLGYSDMDEGWLIGWFCNAIMAGFDEASRRSRAELAAARERAAKLERMLERNAVSWEMEGFDDYAKVVRDSIRRLAAPTSAAHTEESHEH